MCLPVFGVVFAGGTKQLEGSTEMRDWRYRSARCAGKAFALATVVGFTGLQTLTPAQAFSKRVQKACLEDYKNLCPQYRTNSPQLRACMESKANAISWGCIEALIDSGEVDRKRVRR